MPNFKKLYFRLFNKVSDTVEDLQEVQCEIEEEIISDPDYTDDENGEGEEETDAPKSTAPKGFNDQGEDDDFGVC